MSHVRSLPNTDSKNVVAILKRGSMKQPLQKLAVQIFNLCRQYRILLHPVWIPRNLNDHADALSRIIDSDNWAVTWKWFSHICATFRLRVDVDRFADNSNNQVPLFNSRFFLPEAAGVDAFAQNWRNTCNWAVPPIYLIPRLLKFMVSQPCLVILVIPEWPSAIFWPYFLEFRHDQTRSIRRVLKLGNIFTRGRNSSSMFGSHKWKSNTLAIHYDSHPDNSFRLVLSTRTHKIAYIINVSDTEQSIASTSDSLFPELLALSTFISIQHIHDFYVKHHCHFSEIVSPTLWTDAQMLRNPKLQLLANILPDIIAASRQPNTVKVHVTWYNRFLKWAKNFEELDTMPVSELTIAMFMLSLYQQGWATSSLQQCVSVMNWIDDLLGCKKPTDSPLVKLIIEGSIRLNAKVTQRKKPITVDMIRELKHHMLINSNPLNLMDHRLLTYMLVSFSGFLRYDEARHIRGSDIQFHSSHLSLFIERSKTDIYRTGMTVLIARTNTDLCPVKSVLDITVMQAFPKTATVTFFVTSPSCVPPNPTYSGPGIPQRVTLAPGNYCWKNYRPLD